MSAIYLVAIAPDASQLEKKKNKKKKMVEPIFDLSKYS